MGIYLVLAVVIAVWLGLKLGTAFNNWRRQAMFRKWAKNRDKLQPIIGED